MNETLYAVAWLLFVAAQAQNSIKSKTNGLDGWQGFKLWIKAHGVNLATRAFFSGLAYGFMIHTFAAKIQAVGFPLGSHVIAGVSGYAVNGALYQFFGYFPGLRVEMADLAPPAPMIQMGNIAAGVVAGGPAMNTGMSQTGGEPPKGP
jgi:hypothetical protein